MKRLLFITLVCLIANTASAQIKATTEDGQIVLLKDDGTWQYDSTTVSAVDTVIKKMSKPAVDSKCLKSEKVSYDFCYNPLAWSISATKLNEVAEFSLIHKKGDAYAMIITERIGFELEAFKDALIERMKNFAKETTILTEEKIMVNGIPAFHVRTQAKVGGMVLIYDSYYISDDNGAIQLTTFTGKSIFKQYEKDFTQLLNGVTRRKLASAK